MGLNSSHISGLNTSQLNRNSNIKKVIRGGQGSIYARPSQRSSTMVGDMAQMLISGNGAERIRASFAGNGDKGPFERDQADVDYVKGFFEGKEGARQSNSSYMVRKDE